MARNQPKSGCGVVARATGSKLGHGRKLRIFDRGPTRTTSRDSRLVSPMVDEYDATSRSRGAVDNRLRWLANRNLSSQTTGYHPRVFSAPTTGGIRDLLARRSPGPDGRCQFPGPSQL